MLHVERMKRLSQGKVNPIFSHELDEVSWDTLFDDEQELLDALMNIRMNDFVGSYNGDSYLVLFQNTLKRGKQLSPKQMIQLKRLAKEVYCFTWNNQNTTYHD